MGEAAGGQVVGEVVGGHAVGNMWGETGGGKSSMGACSSGGTWL